MTTMSHALIAIPFHGQSLSAVLVDNIPHVALKPLCENIGLDWSAQVQKIKRHAVLKSVMVMITTTGNDGKMYEMLMMPIKYLNGWLFGVDSSRVNLEIKDRVIEYQYECFEVLANHFMPKVETQYGLKSLPPSPYISEAEAAQLKKSLATHCQKTGVNNYAELYGKIYAYFGITSYKHIPNGKLEEAARLIGVKLVAVKKPVLPTEPMKLSFTPEELEDLVSDRLKSIQGELVNEPMKAHDLNLMLPDDCRVLGTRKGGVTVKIELVPDDVKLHTIDEFIGIIEMGFILIDKNRLDDITLKQLGTLLA